MNEGAMELGVRAEQERRRAARWRLLFNLGAGALLAFGAVLLSVAITYGALRIVDGSGGAVRLRCDVLTIWRGARPSECPQ